MSNEEKPVLLERKGRVAWVTLNRASAMNALSQDLVRSFRTILATLTGEAELAALVVTSAGDKAFCAGADLKERRGMTLEQTRAFLLELNALMDEVATFPRPVIAAINGAAFGGGLELALACDLRLAAAGVEVGLPEVRLGIIPGAGGTQRLSRLCGIAVAKELILTGRRIDTDRALALGVMNAVVPRAELQAETQRWAADLAEGGPLALAQAKRAIDAGFGRPMPDALAAERACYDVVLTSDDRNEGLAAFAEKRKPTFRGR